MSKRVRDGKDKYDPENHSPTHKKWKLEQNEKFTTALSLYDPPCKNTLYADGPDAQTTNALAHTKSTLYAANYNKKTYEVLLKHPRINFLSCCDILGMELNLMLFTSI